MTGAPVRGAVVTGAAGGIGGATVTALAQRGYRVMGLDLVGAAGDGTIACDVRDGGSCGRSVEEAVRRLGRLDAVVHAAGIAKDGVLWKLPPSDWDDVIATNLTSAFHLCRAAVPHLRAAGGGAVVLVSSINGERGKFGQSAYAASKAGLHGLAKSLAREVGGFGIRVNVVAPGLVATAMTASLPEDVRQAALRESCLGRAAEPEDVAGVIAFLCSPDARHVTGQVLRVDGGQLT